MSVAVQLENAGSIPVQCSWQFAHGTPCVVSTARLCVSGVQITPVYAMNTPIPRTLSVEDPRHRTENLVQHGFSTNPLSAMQSAPCGAPRRGLLFS
jgi:hypothetical protein